MKMYVSSIYEQRDFVPTVFDKLEQIVPHIQKQWYDEDGQILAQLELARALCGVTDIYVVEHEGLAAGCLLVKGAKAQGVSHERAEYFASATKAFEDTLTKRIQQLPKGAQLEATKWIEHEDAIDALRIPKGNATARDLGYNLDAPEISLFIVGESLRGLGAGSKMIKQALSDMQELGHSFTWLKTDSWCDYQYYLKRSWQLLSEVFEDEGDPTSGNYFVLGKAL